MEFGNVERIEVDNKGVFFMIDSHIHLHQYDVDELETSVPTWKEAGIEKVVAVSMNWQSSIQTLTLHERFPDFVLPAIGYHPEQSLPTEEELDKLTTLIKENAQKVVAIGEVGLPYYEKSSNKQYEDLLEYFVKLSVHLDLPIVLHAVHDTAERALYLLKKHEVKKAHFHWLKAPEEVVKEIVEAGYYISVTPEVCYRKRDERLVEIVPLEQLLVETDGPWSYDGPFQNVETTPLLIEEICKVLANKKGKEVEEIMIQTSQNAKKLFQYGGKS